MPNFGPDGGGKWHSSISQYAWASCRLCSPRTPLWLLSSRCWVECQVTFLSSSIV